MENISIEKYKEVATKEERMLHRLIDEFILNNSKFLIIEGPAGSGKTEAIRYLSQKWEKGKYLDLKKNSINIAYSAPSRQAASNLRLRNIQYARTTQKYISDFYNKKINVKDVDVLVVDEASLLPRSAIQNLYEKTKLNSKMKYIFLGDSSQNFPWCPQRKSEERSFPALNYETLFDIFGLPYYQHNLEKIKLTAQWRFISRYNPMSESFITLLRNLREGSINLSLKSLIEYPEINQFNEDNLISNLININSSGIARDIKKIVDSKLSREDSIELCLTLLKTSYYWENNEKRSFNEFSEETLKKGIELRFDLSTSRPVMGEIYNKKFKSNKKNSSNVISLFRSNDHVHQANLDLRPHLDHVKKDEIEKLLEKHNLPTSFANYLPVKGDFLYIAGEDDRVDHVSQGESSKYQESLFPGDLVVATSHPSKPSNNLLNQLFGDKNYFFNIELKPLIYLPDSISERLGQFIVRQSRECVVWIGGVVENKVDAYKLYREQIEQIKGKILELEKALNLLLPVSENIRNGFYGNILRDEDEYYFKKSLNTFNINLQQYKNVFLSKTKTTRGGKVPTRYSWEQISPTTRKRKRAPHINSVSLDDIKEQRKKYINEDIIFLKSVLNSSILIYYAYALTHKTAQGGEWDNVIIESSDVWEDIDKNRFLYTALSRSKNKIYLSYFK